MIDRVYVVTAYRYGDHEKHSYVVGAYTTIKKAMFAKEGEERYRGGKYECEIVDMKLNFVNEGWTDVEIY
jgi:hypothetical protein